MNLVNDYGDSINKCHKEACKIKSSHVATRLKFDTIYDSKPKLSYSRK